jgi:hypothetical protein
VIEGGIERVVDLTWANSNQIVEWLRRIERLQALEKPASLA